MHVEIIKRIQACHEQYKFQANLHNVGDYFLIQIRPEWCPLENSHKLQVSSARPFKVLQIIESNSYVIKLLLNFDISSIFDMKDLVICKTRQPMHLLISLPHHPYHWHKKNILILL